MRLLRVTRIDGNSETFGVPHGYQVDPFDLATEDWLIVPGVDGASFVIRTDGVAWFSTYDEIRDREEVPA